MIGGVQAVPDHFDHPLDAAEFKRPPHLAGVELYRAHIVRHAFEPHTHEAFGLGAIESGVERFRYRGTEHLAPADTLVLMNPDELHTGRAETLADQAHLTRAYANRYGVTPARYQQQLGTRPKRGT